MRKPTQNMTTAAANMPMKAKAHFQPLFSISG
jgi:hypothetical protein